MGLALLNQKENYVIGIWKIVEPLDKLERDLKEKNHEKFKSTKRQLEYICTRLLLRKINKELIISYNKFGAPKLNNDKNISISHSDNLIAIIISDKNVAIDIEKISEKALKIKDKFISKKDNVLLNIKETTLTWSAKEVVYKLHQKGGVDFKKDIIVKKIDSLKNKIHIIFNKKSIVLNYQKINQHFLVYVCN